MVIYILITLFKNKLNTFYFIFCFDQIQYSLANLSIGKYLRLNTTLYDFWNGHQGCLIKFRGLI